LYDASELDELQVFPFFLFLDQEDSYFSSKTADLARPVELYVIPVQQCGENEIS
jgi:hypothetical protein